MEEEQITEAVLHRLQDSQVDARTYSSLSLEVKSDEPNWAESASLLGIDPTPFQNGLCPGQIQRDFSVWRSMLSQV